MGFTNENPGLPLGSHSIPERIPHDSRITQLFWDPRSEARPSKFARAFLGSPGATAAIAKDPDGSRCAVAGRESLKIIRIRDLHDSQSEQLVQAQTSRRAARVLGMGPGGAQLLEELNLWAHSRLPPTSSAMTDVIWGTGPSSNKIATSCSNGDVILWDISKGGSKLEKVWREEHQRAVNCILFGPTLPHLLLTGSQDTIVKIWDIRVPHGARLSLPHSTAVRALAMSPNPLSASVQHQCVVALEGGDIVRWDIRAVGRAGAASSDGNLSASGGSGGKMPLDKVPVAHQGAVLGMDWAANDGKGWLCTGGQDKTVKIWDVSLPTFSSTPVHTLHAPHPIKRVKWRPKNPTEIAVVPRTVGISPLGMIPSNPSLPGQEAAKIAARFAPGTRVDQVEDPDRVEIWDIRRHHISKYVLLGSEGACGAAIWTDSDSFCAVYRNGALTRHDVQHSYTPIDRIPRHSITWDAMGGMSFITGKRDMGEIPFDDTVPALNFPPKTAAEAPFESSQISAYIAGPIGSSFNKQAFRILARSYMLEGASPIIMCEHNSTVAAEVGDWNAVQVWDKLRGLLSEVPPLTPQASQNFPRSRSSSRNSIKSFADNTEGHSNSFFPRRIRMNSRSPSVELASRHASRDKHHRRHRRRVSSLSKSSTRSSVTQSLSRSGSRNISRHPDRYRSSLSPNNVLSRRNGPMTSNHIPVTNPTHQKSSSMTSLQSQHSSSSRRSGVSPSLSRVSGSRARPIGSSNRERRKPLSETRGNDLGRVVPDTRNRSHSFGSTAALLALGESDDTGSGERSDDEDDDLDDSDVSLDGPSPRRVLPVHLGSLRETYGGNANVPSPQMFSMNIKNSLSQRAPDPLDTGALADDNYDSSSPIDEPHYPPSRSFLNKSVPPSSLNPHGGKIILPVRAIDHYLNTRKADEEKQGIPRVFSEQSVQTAVPSRQPHPYSSFMFSQKQEAGSEALLFTNGMERPDLNKFQGGLTVKVHVSDDDKVFQGRGRGRSRSFRWGNKISDIQREEIRAAHQRIWEIGWQSLRDRIEREIESGNIQLAAAVCIVGDENVFMDRQRIEDLCATYVEMLTRLRLFTSAARVRKFSKFEGIHMTSMLDTDIYMACAKCRKAFLVPAHLPRNRENSGLFQYCKSCREGKARCSICHLPVKGLLFFCQSCSHGGHQECYRGYVATRPLIRGPCPRPSSFDFRGRPIKSRVDRTWAISQLPLEQSTQPVESSSIASTEPDGQSDVDEGSFNLQRTNVSSFASHDRVQLRFHVCPAGCGHSCWGNNDATQLE